MKTITLKFTEQELINLTRLVYQDLQSIKEYEKNSGSLSVPDRLAQKFGNKFLPKLCKILNINEPEAA